ncbi:MAG: hypothetical protein BIFFINMI_00250 [Phycisphaerae bacterium]|nr:hypothetical protein [Phycisphaerae bacterium]
MRRLAFVSTVAALFALPGLLSAGDFDVKLTVRETAAAARTAEPVSGGVPFPRGLLKEPTGVKLVDDAGKEVPAQFSAINRWGDDNSVMWLLVNARTDVTANGEATYHLQPGPATAKAADSLTVEQTPDAITINVGKLGFTVSRKKLGLIQSSVTLANGETYTSTAAPPDKVEVEEAGPQRATILVRGRLTFAGEGKATLPYCYGYIVRIRAYAGRPELRISYSLTNDLTPVIGMPVVKDAKIFVPVKEAGQSQAGKGWIAAGQTAMAVRYLAENSPAKLAVEGNDLVLRPWGDGEQFLDVYTYKTYEIQLASLEAKDPQAAADAQLVASNDALRFWAPTQWVSDSRAWGDFGYVAIADAEMAKAITRRIELASMVGYVKGRFKSGDPSQEMWRYWGADPEFESGASSAPGGGYEPLLKTAPLFLTYLQTGDRRFFDEAERVSWHWRDRRMTHIDQDFSATRWEGSGFYRTKFTEALKLFPSVQPPQSRVNAYLGAWNYGGPWGPMDTQHFSVDEVVGYYYLTGDRLCLDALDMYGQEAMSFVAAFTRQEKATVSRAHGWVTRALVSVYEATNDPKFLKAARDAVHAIVRLQDKTAGTISPAAEKGRDGKVVTHTPFMAAAVGMALGRYYRHYPEEDVRDAFLGIADWLYYDVAIPGGGFSYHWSADNAEKKSVSGHRCMSTMSWAYLATGKKRYMEAADLHAGLTADTNEAQRKKILAYWQVNGFGQEYVTLKSAKRADDVPPAAVTDLKAEALGDGKVKLAWTAPGDDANAGQAAVFQVKCAAKAIVEHADWRAKADSEISFWAATNCAGEPAPGPAGTAESFTVTGLTPGVYWFALKSYDEMPNQSELSNVVKVEVK